MIPRKPAHTTWPFTVRNLSKEALTYHMKAVLLVPGSDTVDTKYGKRDVMLANDVLLRKWIWVR